MPAYNAERTISDSIESLISQTYKNLELIVIDDCSNDHTRRKILEQKDSRIKLLKNSVNKGVAYSRNIGMSNANGRYIAFCDSDDCWHPEKLSKQIPFLKKYPIVCSNYFMVDERMKILKEIKGPREFSYSKLLQSNFIPNSSAIFDKFKTNKNVLQKEIGHEDYLMWLELLKPDKMAYRIQEPLMYYRSHKNSLSANKVKGVLWTWNIYSKELNLNVLCCLFYIIIYVYINLKKHYLK
jgi:glycosyltransferase involved in cell wall biosynthesis